MVLAMEREQSRHTVDKLLTERMVSCTDAALTVQGMLVGHTTGGCGERRASVIPNSNLVLAVPCARAYHAGPRQSECW